MTSAPICLRVKGPFACFAGPEGRFRLFSFDVCPSPTDPRDPQIFFGLSPRMSHPTR